MLPRAVSRQDEILGHVELRVPDDDPYCMGADNRAQTIRRISKHASTSADSEEAKAAVSHRAPYHKCRSA